jgi:hypothetical protein
VNWLKQSRGGRRVVCVPLSCSPRVGGVTVAYLLPRSRGNPTTITPAPDAPRNSNQRAWPRRTGDGSRHGPPRKRCQKRLSATDISALASMKNVAKCDTWCELQNPVNHRVFERKLRPKPLGRGHVCLGVTHRCPKQRRPSGMSERSRCLGGSWPPVSNASWMVEKGACGGATATFHGG